MSVFLSFNGIVGKAIIPMAQEMSQSTLIYCVLCLKLLHQLLCLPYLIKSIKLSAMMQYQSKLNNFLGKSS